MSIGEGERAAAGVSERRGEQLRRLAAAALLINSTVEIEELLSIITEQARETIGATRAVTSLAADGSREQAITTVATAERGAERRDAAAWPPDDDGLVALVCRENRTVRLGRAELAAHPFLGGFPADGELYAPRRGWLAAPLIGRDGRNLGLVHLSDKEEGEFGEEDESILVQLAQMASAAVEHARLYRDLARRADELDAIYGLADAVARADTLDAILDDALHAMERAAGVDRSSVVLFDDTGGIDFRAWRGLSEEYRSAVRGTRPWKDRLADPRPFVVDDVLADQEVAELHDVFRREGIRSMAIVPLVQAGSALGRFVLYADRPAAFSPADVQLAETMASHAAAAAHRRRAEAGLRESRNQLAAIFRSVADGITAQAPDGSIVYANEAAASFSGFESLEEFLATPVQEIVGRFDLLDEHGEPLPLEELPGRIALAEGREAERVIQYRSRDTRERRWAIVRATPVLGDEGGVRLAINVFHDLTQQRRAEERLRVLADAGRTLSSSEGVDETLAELARLVVPAVADYCLVDRLAGDGTLRHVVHVHVDPAGEATLDALRRRFPVLGNPAHPVARVVATHEPLFEVDADRALDRISLNDEHRTLYARLAPSAFLAVPLVARGRTLGAISMGTTVESGRRLDEEDLALALELAERAALAVENAALYEEAQAELTERLRSEERLRFLARAGKELAGSLDVDATLRSIARLAVPAVTDWCIVYERRPDGSIERLAVEHAGDDAERVRSILEQHPLDPEAEVGVARVVRDAEPELVERLTAAELARDTSDPDGLAADVGVDPCSLITVPLVARGRTLGAISLLTAESGRVYGQEDLALATELAGRAALAVDNARLFREAKRAEELQRFLAEASATLASSLRVDRSLEGVAFQAVPRFADWCSIALIAEDGAIQTVAVAHEDREKAAWARELLQSNPSDPAAQRGAAAVIRSGRPDLVSEITDELLVEATRDRPAVLEPLRGLGLRSWLIVPLVARDRVVGALSLVTDRESGRVLGESDVELAVELAHRAATAVDNARLFQQTEFQRAVLERQGEASIDGLLVVGADASILSINERFREIWQIPDEAIAQGDDAALAAAMERVEDPEAFIARVRELYARRESSREELRFRDGRTIERYGSPVTGPDGSYLGYLWSFRDISDRIEVERALEARARAAQALEFVGDGVFLIDASERVALWNPAATRITGIEEADVLGEPAEEALAGWPLDRLGERTNTFPIEISGHELWLSLSAVRFPEGTVVAFRDLTEEYALERLKTDFVSTVSHELRTPLAAIYGAAMTLRRTDVALGDDQRIGLLGVVADESERLARIVNDVLWASRLDSGALEVSIESCDPGLLATAVVAAARTHLPAAIDLTLVVPAELPPVAADPDKVRQVLVNLVDNAVKYSPDGGLVEVRVEPSATAVRFVVSDRGLGIPPSEHGRIFEKFFRLDPNLTRGVGGTGLGLYICRELVRRMDGRIWVESDGGRGSTFAFELPVAAQPA